MLISVGISAEAIRHYVFMCFFLKRMAFECFFVCRVGMLLSQMSETRLDLNVCQSFSYKQNVN